jgi:hypothetical protein
MNGLRDPDGLAEDNAYQHKNQKKSIGIMNKKMAVIEF